MAEFLEDTVEYFNLVLQVRLNAEEKKEIVAFLRMLQRASVQATAAANCANRSPGSE